METRKCKTCNEIKPILDFPPSGNPSLSGKIYRRYNCKKCFREEKREYDRNYKREHKNHYTKLIKEWRKQNPEKSIFTRAKNRASQNNLPFNIELSDIVVPEFCPVLGIPLFVGENKLCDNSPSLDRIKPELGYVKGNIIVLSNRANRLKNNATTKELEQILSFMKENGCL